MHSDMKMLILDNYDSFTYNIVQLVRSVGGIEPDVRRNDCISLEEVNSYESIILSPGPGIPSEAGLMPDLIKSFAATKRILGICLGHQAIGEAFGAKLLNMPNVLHGVASGMRVCIRDSLLNGLPNIIEGGHYHSWIVDKQLFPDSLEVLMEDSEGNIMAIRHKHYDLKGLQFHPESVLTPQGKQIISNWINHQS